MALEVGSFTVKMPKVTSYSPKEAGIDEIVTLKGEGFGEFLKIAEATRLELNTDAHDWKNYRLGPDVSRTEVLVNGVAAVVVSWKDTEIKVQVPRRHVFGFGHPEGFYVGSHQGGNRRASRVLGSTQKRPVLFPEAVAERRGG